MAEIQHSSSLNWLMSSSVRHGVICFYLLWLILHTFKLLGLLHDRVESIPKHLKYFWLFSQAYHPICWDDNSKYDANDGCYYHIQEPNCLLQLSSIIDDVCLSNQYLLRRWAPWYRSIAKVTSTRRFSTCGFQSQVEILLSSIPSSHFNTTQASISLSMDIIQCCPNISLVGMYVVMVLYIDSNISVCTFEWIVY